MHPRELKRKQNGAQGWFPIEKRSRDEIDMGERDYRVRERKKRKKRERAYRRRKRKKLGLGFIVVGAKWPFSKFLFTNSNFYT